MKISLKFFFIVLGSGLFSVSNVTGQSLQTELVKIFDEGDNAMLRNYSAPLSKAFGAGLSSSKFHNAEAYDFPHFDFGINYLTVNIPASARQDSNSQVTVFGKMNSDTSHVSGLNISTFKLPVLQLNFSLGDNTNIFLRYTHWNDQKLGDISVFGAGVKYELENLFSISPIPFSIGILAAYQKYQIESYVEGAAFDMNLILAKQFYFLPFEVYGAAGYLNNVTNIERPLNSDGTSISVDGLEEIRYLMGLNFSLRMVNLSIEYGFGDYSSFSSGLRIVF